MVVTMEGTVINKEGMAGTGEGVIGATETRADHLQGCKNRAIKYCDMDDCANAWASMVSDLMKHPGTRDHTAIELGARLIINGNVSTAEELKKFILGFH